MTYLKPLIRRWSISLSRMRRWIAGAFPLRDAGPLAEPWRRLAAASIDTLLVLLAATAIDAENLTLLGSSDKNALHRVASWIALGAWLYVLAGWSLGATLGMRAMGIRLVRVTAPERSVGFKSAMVRLVGYWGACLPVKGGLWPILTHPLRQGWHDRLAGTVVIRQGRGTALPELIAFQQTRRAAAPTEICGDYWPPPDLRLALRGFFRSGSAFAAILCLVLAFTYPVAWHLRTRAAGAPGDSAIFLWAQWYVPTMLRHHLPLTHTVYSFYPSDVSLAYSTMEWFNGFVALPLSRWFNPIAVYNILWLGSLTLCAFTSYLLIAAITRSRLAAFAVAPVFGLCPYFLVHGLGHDNLISAEFLPPLALCAYAWLTLKQARYAMAAGVFWALAGWCDLQFLLFGGLILTAFFCAFWWGYPDAPKERRVALGAAFGTQARQIAALAGCFLIGMSWLIVPLVQVKLHGNTRFTDRMAQVSAKLSDYYAPNQFAALTPAERTGGRLLEIIDIESAVAPGLLVIALAAASPLILPRRLRRGLMPWWALLIGAAVLSLGSVLASSSAAQDDLSDALSLLLAFPGNGFALPWHFEAAAQAGLTILGGDWQSITSIMQPIWLPYSWAWTILPLIRAFRGTARLGALVDLSAAALAAAALRPILARAGKRHGRVAPILIAIGCVAMLFWEYDAVPYPAFRPIVSPAVASLRGGPPQSPVLEIPLADSPETLIDQTVYGRPAFDGFLSRLPDSVQRQLNSNAFLVYAMSQGSESGVVSASADKISSQRQLQTGLNELYSVGLRDIIVHPSQLGSAATHQDEALLQSFGAVKTADDHGYAEVFHLTAPPSSVHAPLKSAGSSREASTPPLR